MILCIEVQVSGSLLAMEDIRGKVVKKQVLGWGLLQLY